MQMSFGEQVRDFVNVTQVAAGFVDSLIRQDLVPGKPLIENLASGEPKSLGQFASEQWESLGATGKLQLGKVPMRPEEVMRYVPQI